VVLKEVTIDTIVPPIFKKTKFQITNKYQKAQGPAFSGTLRSPRSSGEEDCSHCREPELAPAQGEASLLK